jgi:hypothetical protein
MPHTAGAPMVEMMRFLAEGAAFTLGMILQPERLGVSL